MTTVHQLLNDQNLQPYKHVYQWIARHPGTTTLEIVAGIRMAAQNKRRLVVECIAWLKRNELLVLTWDTYGNVYYTAAQS